jgi:predicted DNA binding CopG/RHH family protein
MSNKLDKYEQEIESNFDTQPSIRNNDNNLKLLQNSAKTHLKKKYPITILL